MKTQQRLPRTHLNDVLSFKKPLDKELLKECGRWIDIDEITDIETIGSIKQPLSSKEVKSFIVE